MFGNAPRALWERWVTPDENHRIPLACRALLIEDGTQKILVETGIGAFFEPKLKERFGVVESDHVLLTSLDAMGLSHEDIDVVVLSHLHFDHAGGLLSAWSDTQPSQLLFPNATYVVGEDAWERAQHPHMRDKASFIPALNSLLAASGRLEVVFGRQSDVLGPDYQFHQSHGHTPGLLLLEVAMPDGPVVFAGDLIPGTAWVHLPITMGYDRYPELLINEKEALLADLVQRGGRLFYTHDSDVAMSGVEQDQRGRFVASNLLGNLERLSR